MSKTFEKNFEKRKYDKSCLYFSFLYKKTKMSEKDKLLAGLCQNRYLHMLFNDPSKYFGLNFICLNFKALVFKGSDEDDEDAIMEFGMNVSLLLANRRTCHLHVPKSEHWLKNVLVNFDDGRMRQMIRINKDEFDHILELIKSDPVFHNARCVSQLPINLQLQIALFRFGGNGDSCSIRKIATLFGVGDGGTIITVTQRVIRAVLNLKTRFLHWPSNEERKKIVKDTMHELPGCVAYIDGTEIKLAEAPAENHELFFSRKKQYSIKVQIVCDYNLKIRHVTIGHYGSVHDAKMFAESSIGMVPENFLSQNQFIAADSAYPLSRYIITPFRQNSNELSKEIRDKFNEYFSKRRVRVENCIGKLKEVFCSLKEIRFRLNSQQNHKAACEWILACCVLHNIVIKYNSQENIGEIGEPEYPQDLQLEPNFRAALALFIANNH